MGQIIINTGNIANDGTGAPLRTAFTDTNYNFTQLFAAGPAGSNITIANNTIQVTNTNGNLRLATNGTGVVVPAANFVPDIPNVRSIGLGTNRFTTVYAQYINAATGTFSGNVYVDGNLQVTGNVVTVDYSTLSVANSSIILATGAANAAQANGGGLLIPIANANLTYNYSANTWDSTIAVTAPTFVGDGANLTNVIANVQASALLGSTFSNSINYSNLTSFGLVTAISATGNISTTGNVYANTFTGNTVSANYISGDGSRITNITANAIVGNVPFAVNAGSAYTANLAALATQAINADTALFAINANLAAWANTATIAQTANASHYAIQADNANAAVVAGMAYELSPAANLSITGNITTGGYFIGDGSLISNIVVTTSYGNSNVASYLQNLTTNVSTTGNITADGNITGGNILTGEQVIANGEIQSGTGLFTGGYLSVNGSSDLANVNVSGNLSAVGNINAATFSASGNILSNSLIATGVVYAGIDGQLTTSNSMTFADVGGEMTLTVDYFSTSTVFTNDILGDGNNINVSAQYGNSVLFDTTGGVSASGNITGNYFIGDGSQLTNLPGGNATLPLANGTSNFDIATANGNATITANTGNTWTFAADGNLTIPGAIYGPADSFFNIAVTDSGPGAVLQLGDWDIAGFPKSLVQVSDNVHIVTGVTTGGGDWNFDNTGLLTLPGGGTITSALGSPQDGLWLGYNGHRLLLNSDGQFWTGGIQLGGNALPGYVGSYGNITLNANIGTGPLERQWVFDTDGSMIAPGDISATGNVTATNFVTSGAQGNITGANVISAITFSATGNIFGNAITLKNSDDFAQIVFSNDGGNTNNGQIKVDGGTNMVVSAASNFYVKQAGSDRIAVTDTTSDFMAATNVRIQSNKAGSAYTWTFNDTGNLILPGNIIGSGSSPAPSINGFDSINAIRFSATGNVTANIFVGNGSGLTNVAQQTRGSWSVVAGTNTYSFTVPAGTWQMWVTGNIPNGIIAWNATATVTNTNVPVVGQQYTWVYDGAGSPIDFVSIPNQFVGTGNSIVRSNVAPSTTTNRFDFSINNTSGNTQTVYYGYTAL